MRYFVFFILSFFLNFNLFSQQNNVGIITYKIGLYDKPAISNNNSQINVTGIESALLQLEYELIFSNSASLYRLIENVAYSDFDYNMAISIAGGKSLHYKNIKTKSKIEQKSELEAFNIIKDYNEFKWEITKETKVIGKYTCYKATCHVEYFSKIRNKVISFDPVVWFTYELPYPFGPKGIDGLPGLIIEASMNGRLYFYATKISLTSQYKISEINLKKVKKELTLVEYEDMISNK